MICCTLFVFAHYASGNDDQTAVQKGVELFKTPAAISKNFDTDGTSNDGLITPTDFYSPFLVATDDVIVALAGVNTTDSGDKFNLLTRYVEIKEDEWLTEATNNNFDKNWQKQFAVKKDLEHKKKHLKFILAAAKGKNIYVLLVNDTAQDGSSAPDAATQCNYCIIFGTVSKTATLKIEWQAKAPLTDNNGKLKEQLTLKSLKNIPSNGYVLFEEKEKLLFALEFDQVKKNKEKLFAFIEFKETEPTITFAEFEAEGQCKLNLFLWKKKIMMAKYCGDKGGSIQELQDGNKGWESTKEPISRLLYHLENKNNFIAAKINNENVLLFTQQKKKAAVGSTQKNENCVDLWMTDGSRSYNVGPIVTSDKEIPSAGLLHTKGHLFFFCTSQKNQKPFFLSTLTNS